MKINVRYYKTAGITVQVNSDFQMTENTFHPKFKLFQVNGPGKETIVINHHFHSPNLFENSNLIENEIYNKDPWQIFKTKDLWIYKYTPSLTETSGYPVIGVFNNDHTAIKIYAPGIDETRYKKSRFNALTLFNSDQILFSKLLCERKGLILHSNGFDISGNGILLTGKSGAGKSTLSNMLKNKGFTILCDDRMFIRQKEAFYIYGSWCHGTVPDVSANFAPLKAIFFLEQSKYNLIQKINNKNEIFQKLITSVVRPFLGREEWNLTLKTLEALVNSTKCYIIKFDLSGKICDLISELFNNDKNVG